MPFRLGEEYDGGNRAKVQFITAAWMPHRIYQACKKTGTLSNTVYVQRAVCEALARDLGLPLDELLADLPTPRTHAKHLHDPSKREQKNGSTVMVGPANTIEEVR